MKSDARLDVFAMALEAIRALRGPLASLAERDARQASELRRRATSAATAIVTARRVRGRDRTRNLTAALAMTAEVHDGLLVAEAWGDLPQDGGSGATRALARLMGGLREAQRRTR